MDVLHRRMKTKIIIWMLVMISIIGILPTVQGGAITDNIYSSYSFETELQDDSNGQNNYSLGNAPNYVTNATCKVGNSCYHFDGVDDYLGVNGGGNDVMDSFDDNYTISMWVYNPITTANVFFFDSEGRVATVGTTNTSHYSYNVYSGGDNKVYAPFTINTWEHFIIWYNKTDQRIYKNNVLIDSSSGATDDSQTRPTRIGSAYNGNYFKGYIDQVVIWRRAITTIERATMYNSGNEYDPYDPPPEVNFTITATDFFNSTSINVFNATVNGTFYDTISGTIITSIIKGVVINLSVEAENYLSKTYTNYNTSSDLATELYYYKPRFILEEKIRSFPENTTITNYSLSFYNMNTSTIETITNTTNGNMTAYLTWNNTYNITVDAPGYEVTNFIYTANQSFNYPNFIYLYTTNSIQIYIKDEDTNQNLTGNTSIRFTSNTTEFTNYTTTSAFYIDNLPSGIWQLLITSNNTAYSSRKYTLTVYNRSHQTLTAYLSENTSITTFTVSDKDTGEFMEGVLTTMYKLINGSWEAVESKFTDITGSVQLNYNPITQYKFFLAKTGYDDYIFYLSPVLYSEYNIFMEKSTVYNLSQDLDKIAIIYAPSSFIVGTNNFKWIIQSPYGELINYGYTITYPGGSNTTSGNNAIGNQLETGFNITSADIWDKVILKYYYTTSLAGTRNFTITFPITNPGYGNNTISHNLDNTYGLGLFERIFLATLIVIFVIGIATLVGQAIPGVALGVFVMGYLVYNGFVPIWSVIISMILAVWLLSMEAK